MSALPYTVEITIPRAEARTMVLNCIKTHTMVSVMVRDEVEWCQANVIGNWSFIATVSPRRSGIFQNSIGQPGVKDYSTWQFSFENERDAVLFKTFHGGAR